MFARSALRVARVAAAPSVTKVSRAAFSAGSRLRNAEFVGEKEVPVVTYSRGEAQRSTFVVDQTQAKADADAVIPLSQEVYDAMTPSLQKMTIKDKTVIVTGYVQSSLHNVKRRTSTNLHLQCRSWSW